ncbi:MAG: hypothetical protein M0P04_06675 [Syntrophales bacterium]|jgi:hypothetical protein|nr:hypothetical protein [Syntrophales bacterium]MDD4339546.1 hypothetical protein [Syntrophales bacterium]HOG07732.1 hypothetical protein [Syntrophales bacterium]HOS76572.1 hypothetical protein [Syntrophales bacterium]HPB70594.1 hypothetical protein [Syntrophales bacterium]
MKAFGATFLLGLALLAVGGCAALPPLTPLDPSQKPTVLSGCREPFLKEKYRLVHVLTATLPGGSESAAIGVLVADPGPRRFQTVIMTLEGWVLFDATVGEALVVNRAVPPFDGRAFVEALVEDIRLAMFPPEGEPIAWGRGEGGAAVCRFARPDGTHMDVLRTGEDAAEVRLYGTGQGLRKRVRIGSWSGSGPAGTLEIESRTWPSYALYLRLLEQERLETEKTLP